MKLKLGMHLQRHLKLDLSRGRIFSSQPSCGIQITAMCLKPVRIA
uniref:Uncharacterized protein n=1 Tax=Arundo donax TaxID=35708 RepID=A0A0A9DQH5_ARUDO